MKENKLKIIPLLMCLILLFTSCEVTKADLSVLTDSGGKYAPVNDNVPVFTAGGITAESFEHYSELDELGRCGAAFACIGRDLMPTEERGAIGQIKPSGWQLAKYDIVDGKYLYNRCHLIGYQLTGENANEKNLITGTRSMNVEGMLPFENMVAAYIRETNHHVMYRVTPIFEGENLLAKGVQMEAYSVEDKGEGVSFNVFVFNSQPGIEINYQDGTSRLSADDTGSETEAGNTQAGDEEYILNTNTKKIHRITCSSVKDIREKNKKVYKGTKEALLNNGYSACDRCKP